MSPHLRIAVVLAAIAVAVAAYAFRGDDIGPPHPQEPGAAMPAPAAAPDPMAAALQRDAVAPTDAGAEVDPEGLANGTGGLEIRGVHRDGAIAGAGVNYLLGAVDADRVLHVCAGRDGVAEFTAVPAGDYRLTNDRSDRPRPIEVRAGHTTLVDYTIERGYRVRARVVDEQGLAVAGAEILYGGNVVAESGPDGSFTVLDLGCIELDARCPGYCTIRRLNARGYFERRPAEIVMAAGAGAVDGCISTPGGLAIPNATITLRSVAGPFSKTAYSDASGRFAATAPRGEFDWRADANGFEGASGEITVLGGLPARLDITMIAAPPGAEPTRPSSIGRVMTGGTWIDPDGNRRPR
ncbi:MAG: carboxypeptidase regulatory-like domain-containing protein [Planctomycetes bacterium]|nr:carboxypeptidase regulatory-like domain-containing protein [Planctomycetota bacterium]